MTVESLIPLLSMVGVLVGIGIGYGMLRGAVKSLQVEVAKLANLANAVHGLEVAHGHTSAQVATISVRVDALSQKAHELDMKLAKAGF